jgi:hypothetical protein
MQNPASLPPDSFTEVLARLPPGMDLDALAFATKAIQRRRDIADGASLLRLALARGPGGLSLNQTAVWASLSGLTSLSDPGVKYRLDRSADFLRAIIEQLLAANAGTTCLHWPGRSLRAVDGSCIMQRASEGYDWRVHAGFDLGRGCFSHLDLTDKHGAESLERGAPLAGEVRIADRNFANAAALLHFRQRSGNAADFIVRVRWKSFALHTADGKAFDLISHLGSLPVQDRPHEVLVQAAVPRAQGNLPLRLVILRKPPEATEAARQALRRSAPRKQKTLDPRSLVAAEFLILATSLPAAGYPADDILAAYRLRWQIELAFKRLKSLIHIDNLPTRTPAAGRSWLYAHLILALLCDDISQDFLASSP